ncbi:WSC-domain-containing protein [Jaminaea rosea]|uniref:WSC-domain-containing protein n=1 Tax=Jaminaea rosea TaxID=1569628 RepID=A0A316UNT6_9BASI|nr:WSC-domain-containing protein [Jaminaea rosea]PWN26939.1 WSC-domain-containing protein [Jaminaea rosea]
MTRIAITPALLLTAASLAASSADASVLPRDLIGSILSGVLSTSQQILTSGLQLGSSSSSTSCASGNTVALTGSGSHNVAGSVSNAGTIFFGQQGSASGSMSSTWSDGSLTNNAGATFQLNDFNGTAGSSYSWTLGSFANSGLIQWCSTGSGSYALKCSSGSCTNNGNIVFEQGSSCGWANTQQASGLSQSITHNGCMMLRNSAFTASQNYLGSGCWSIDAGSSLWFNAGTGSKNIASGAKCLNGHSINFPAGSSGGTLRLDSDVYSNFGATIYGFGTKSTLQFPDTINGVSYSGSTLTVNFGSIIFTTATMKLNVGAGYSGSWKYNNPISGYSTVTYSGTVPANSAPGTCSPSVSACGASGPSVPVVSSTSTSSSSTATATSTTTSSTTTSSSTATTSSATTSSTSSSSTTSSSTATSSSSSTTTSSSSTSTSSTTSSSASSTPTINGSTFDYGGVSFPGCFYDAAGSGGARTFSGASTSSPSMTNEYCANFCGSKSYKYSATEYGQECFCSNTAPTKTEGATCGMTCAGNAQETCGGSWSMTVFNNGAFPDTGSKLSSNYATYGSTGGCYADTVSSRTFSAYSFTSPNMTVELCASTCSGKGHAFSGTEYATECYCSDTIPGATSTACNMQCGGAQYETCGGPGALSVVVDNNIAHSDSPTCANLPSGWAVCQEGQKVSGGKCVSA